MSAGIQIPFGRIQIFLAWRFIFVGDYLLKPSLSSVVIRHFLNLKAILTEIGISAMLRLPTDQIICAACTHDFTRFIATRVNTSLGCVTVGLMAAAVSSVVVRRLGRAPSTETKKPEGVKFLANSDSATPSPASAPPVAAVPTGIPMPPPPAHWLPLVPHGELFIGRDMPLVMSMLTEPDWATLPTTEPTLSRAYW
jgi:hypothetical protein